MSEPNELLVRGRCACGKRFRIRHARPGSVVTCPNCGRSIGIRAADLLIAAAGEQLVPLQFEPAELREAIPVGDAELRPAPVGSRPGLTGQTELDHNDALLTAALHGGPRLPSVEDDLAAGRAEQAGQAGPITTAPAQFVEELLRSFSFAGQPHNARMVVATTLGLALPLVIVEFLSGGAGFLVAVPSVSIVTAILLLAVSAVVLACIARFYWRTLTTSAAGQDDIPITDSGWDVWDDALRPVLWLAVITALCAAPALAIARWAPGSVPHVAVQVAIALAACMGSLLWPVAVMSVAIGEHLLFLRPDWLVRCIVGIGWVYLVAWLQVAATAGALVGVVAYLPRAGPWPLLAQLACEVAGLGLVLYLGYVLFRTLGLLYRHFNRRFPWQF
jgi:hypothetical protein